MREKSGNAKLLSVGASMRRIHTLLGVQLLVAILISILFTYSQEYYEE